MTSPGTAAQPSGHPAPDLAALAAREACVEHPPHYNAGTLGIETITMIRNMLTPEEFRGYCKGNALKYLSRELHRGHDTDLAKAAEYLKFALGDSPR